MEADPQDWPREELAALLRRGWQIDGSTLEEVRTGANNVYRAVKLDAPVFVKVTAGTIRPESDIADSTAYLQHVGEQGAPVSRLILAENGDRYDVMPQEDRRYYITVAEAARGRGIDQTCKERDVFAAWGAAAASLHKATVGFDTTPYQYLEGSAEWERIQNRCADAPADIRNLVDEIGEWRDALPRPAGGLPLTHGDMNAGNIIIDGSRGTLIDFDEPMLVWNAADVARPFRETWDQSNEERAQNFAAFVSAYAAVFPLEFEDPKDFENFCTLKNLEMYGWFSKVWKGDEAFGQKVDYINEKLTELILNPLPLA